VGLLGIWNLLFFPVLTERIWPKCLFPQCLQQIVDWYLNPVNIMKKAMPFVCHYSPNCQNLDIIEKFYPCTYVLGFYTTLFI
jgi:hypothetical protein